MTKLSRLIFIILLIILFGSLKEALGAEYYLLKPSEVIFEAERYQNLRDNHIPQYTGEWTYGTMLGTKFDILGIKAAKSEYRLFYNPELKFRATDSQVRQGGLYYEAGLESAGTERAVRLFKRHESLHCLECNEQAGPNKTYQLLDSYVVQLKWRLR
jgi:hypothetical protein